MSLASLSKNRCLVLLSFFAVVAAFLFTSCHQKSDSTGFSGGSDPRQLALQYMAKNQFDEAEASFAKAIQLTPDNILNYSGLARLYLLQKNYSAAADEANAGLKIKPDDTDLQLILAEVDIEKDNKEEAVSELKKILAKNPDNLKANYTMADLGPAGSDATWKKLYLLKAWRLAPANIILHLKLAALYAAANQTDSARFFMEGVKKIAPDFSEAAKTCYDQAISLLQANKPKDALPSIAQFDKLMKPTTAYAIGGDAIDIPELLAGYPGFSTSLGNPAPANAANF